MPYSWLAANLDVTKQRDLSGFYRHLYQQTFAEEPKKAEPEEPVTFKKESVESEFKSRRQYRSRREEEEEEEQEEEVQEKGGSSPGEAGTEQVELTVDNQKSSDADGKSKANRRPAASASLVSAAASDRAAAADRAAEKTVPAAEKSSVIHPETDSESDESSNSKSPEPEVVPPKIKVDIWKKRTTGHLLDEAIQRYLARKAARESMVS